ncbi:MAG: GxxExxY protein [Gemmatimonadetes bacterium]|nr:GxxExxY protein [Gemmatimonadota bacterium]
MSGNEFCGWTTELPPDRLQSIAVMRNSLVPLVHALRTDCVMALHLPAHGLLHSIVGAFYSVYNYYGYGFVESVYCGGMEYELTDRGHHVAREVAIAIEYKGRHVAWQRIDMLVDGKVIVEIKATELLPPYAKRQLVNYLRATPMKTGLLLYFGPRARFWRIMDVTRAIGGELEPRKEQ